MDASIDFSGVLKGSIADGNITNLARRMTEAETNITALGIECDVIATDLAAPYDEEETYSVGDYCTHDKMLYKCNTDISTPEEWNVSHWDAVKVTEDITEINQSLSDYIKIKTITVKKANLSTNMDLSSYVSLDNGYKFLAWQVDGTSNGWITTMPIYISNPSDVRGFPWWHPSLTINGAINFYYFEIKDV